jgi:hypothetical protein
MLIWDDEPSGVVDRIFGALLAFVCSILTFFLAPILLLSKLWAKASILKLMGAGFVFRRLLHMPFFIWILFVSILALGYGANAGTTRTITMLSHIWGTSNDEGVTSRIWMVFIIGFLISCFLMR